MIKRLLSTASIVALLPIWTHAQQDPQFSQNMFNRLAVNPAFAGASDAICGTLISRPQWLGFADAPRTSLLSADMPIYSINSGVGLTIMSDILGQENNTNAKVAYAYRFQAGPGQLAFGIDIGMMSKNLNNNFIAIDPNDPQVPANAATSTVFDAGFGAYYHAKNFYVGLSAMHLPESKFRISDGTDWQSKRHYYFMAGYHHELNADWELRPSLFFKNAPGRSQLDINCNAVYNQKYWGGLSFRPGDAFILLAGANVWKDLRVGLSYDIVTSRLNNYNNGSVEFMVNYCFKINKEKPKTISKTVRFL